KIKLYLDRKKIKYSDLGTYSKESVDASDYAAAVAKKVKKNKNDRGILICGSGVIMAIAANRIKGIRASAVWHEVIAKQAREHNNINILCLSGRERQPNNWKKIVDIFLKTKSLKKQKYKNRIKKLDLIK
ncbi:MAG: RpiB/LacA/LacB family sugar-phosphate isomerase, partial [Patescibacteria group bacterium]